MSVEVATVTISVAYRSTMGGTSVAYHSISEGESTERGYFSVFIIATRPFTDRHSSE